MMLPRIWLTLEQCKSDGAVPHHWDATGIFRAAWFAAGISFVCRKPEGVNWEPFIALPSPAKTFRCGGVLAFVTKEEGMEDFSDVALVAEDGRRFPLAEWPK